MFPNQPDDHKGHDDQADTGHHDHDGRGHKQTVVRLAVRTHMPSGTARGINGRARGRVPDENGHGIGFTAQAVDNQVLVAGQDLKEDKHLHGRWCCRVHGQGGTVDARATVKGHDGFGGRTPGRRVTVPSNVEDTGRVPVGPDDPVTLDEGGERGIGQVAVQVHHEGVVWSGLVQEGDGIVLVQTDQGGQGRRPGQGD